MVAVNRMLSSCRNGPYLETFALLAMLVAGLAAFIATLKWLSSAKGSRTPDAHRR